MVAGGNSQVVLVKGFGLLAYGRARRGEVSALALAALVRAQKGLSGLGRRNLKKKLKGKGSSARSISHYHLLLLGRLRSVYRASISSSTNNYSVVRVVFFCSAWRECAYSTICKYVEGRWYHLQNQVQVSLAGSFASQ